MDLNFAMKCLMNIVEIKDATRHRTISYAPQHNGLAERMNTTILEKS